jgi:isoquinoline 1-oxidoreductase alpha subunit
MTGGRWRRIYRHARDTTVNNRALQLDIDPTPPAVGVARSPEPGRHQVWLRRRILRRLHRSLDGVATRSCSTPVGQVAGRRITTIEGLSANGDHPAQRAWEEIDVPQCGYCQPARS